MSSHVKRDDAVTTTVVAKRFDKVGGEVPAHVRLATALRATIESGDLQPGDALPGDAALMAATGLARGTVRQAVAALRAEGLVQTRQGARTTVLARPRLQPFSELLSFSSWARELGLTPSARVVELGRRAVADELADALRIDRGTPCWMLLRVRLLDGAPVMVERAAYPEAIGALLVEADLEAGSVYATLAERGIAVASGHHRISAIAADAETAALLDLRQGAPLLRQERTVFAADGSPIEFSDDQWRGDAIVLDAANSVQGSQLARRALD
mgnify:CR=1 FL=1